MQRIEVITRGERRRVWTTEQKREIVAESLDSTRAEVQALLDAPDPRSRSGVRDRAMIILAFAAGLRVSELINLRIDQLDCQNFSIIHITGKGRRERILPLWKETAAALKAWLAIRASKGPELFVNASGRAMTRSGFEYILAKHAAKLPRSSRPSALRESRPTCSGTPARCTRCRLRETFAKCRFGSVTPAFRAPKSTFALIQPRSLRRSPRWRSQCSNQAGFGRPTN